MRVMAAFWPQLGSTAKFTLLCHVPDDFAPGPVVNTLAGGAASAQHT